MLPVDGGTCIIGAPETGISAMWTASPKTFGSKPSMAFIACFGG